MIPEKVSETAQNVAVAAGGGTAVWGWFTENIVGLLGLVIAAASMGIGWYYKHKNLKLNERKR